MKGLLIKNGLFGRVSVKRPFLNNKQIKNRLDFAKNYSAWTANQWGKVIFSDETLIQLKPTRRVYVRRTISQCYRKPYTIKTVKYGSKSIMIWGAIKSDGNRMLILLMKNADSIEYQRVLKEGLFLIYKSDSVFQHDGAPCHRSKSTDVFLSNNGICTITDWPAQSPDINIIENILN